MARFDRLVCATLLSLSLGFAVMPAQAAAPSKNGPPMHIPPKHLKKPAPLLKAVLLAQSDAPPTSPKAVTVLQIGDSHTAADVFTGPLRLKLQAKFGQGGAGYFAAGTPHSGVASQQVSVSASDKWTYQSLRTTSQGEQFTLSGYLATATEADETLSWTVKDGGSLSFAVLDFEVLTGPDKGSVQITLDGQTTITQSLNRPQAERMILRVTPTKTGPKTFHKITLRTLDEKLVTVAGLGVLKGDKGLTYVQFGYPGATADALQRLSPASIRADLLRLAPKVVILAFGTNEGFDDELDVRAWTARYRETLHRITSTLPNAKLVLIGPPDGNRLPKICTPEAARAACVPPSLGADLQCLWQTPQHLDPVRASIATLAREFNATYWNWAGMAPRACGAHGLVHASPPLMAGDHVHFTKEGYRRSADLFYKTLLPLLDPVKAAKRALPHH